MAWANLVKTNFVVGETLERPKQSARIVCSETELKAREEAEKRKFEERMCEVDIKTLRTMLPVVENDCWIAFENAHDWEEIVYMGVFNSFEAVYDYGIQIEDMNFWHAYNPGLDALVEFRFKGGKCKFFVRTKTDAAYKKFMRRSLQLQGVTIPELQ